MAPRETPKATPKIQRSIVKNTRVKASPVTKKTTSTKNNVEKVPQKVSQSVEARVRTNTVPKAFTPKSKENKPTTLPGSVSKLGKKASWKRRPKPAHSGVPVPEKMKKLLGKQLQDFDCSF